MKARLYIISFLAGVILLNAAVVAQGWGNKPDKGQDNGQWRQRLQNGDNVPDGERPGMRPGMGPGMRPGPMGGGRFGGMGRGMFGPPMTTEELIAFLEKNDEVKAKQLNEMYKKQPEQFAEYVGMVCELYTPAARIMENDPVAGKLAVRKTSLSLDVKKLVIDYKMAAEDEVKAKIKTELESSLSDQFDVILESQEKEIQVWQEHLQRFESKLKESSEGGESDFRYGRGGRFDRFSNMQDRMKGQIGKRLQDITKWKEQKQQIVQRQLADLIEDVRPFPWVN